MVKVEVEGKEVDDTSSKKSGPPMGIGESAEGQAKQKEFLRGRTILDSEQRLATIGGNDAADGGESARKNPDGTRTTTKGSEVSADGVSTSEASNPGGSGARTSAGAAGWGVEQELGILPGSGSATVREALGQPAVYAGAKGSAEMLAAERPLTNISGLQPEKGIPANAPKSATTQGGQTGAHFDADGKEVKAAARSSTASPPAKAAVKATTEDFADLDAAPLKGKK